MNRIAGIDVATWMLIAAYEKAIAEGRIVTTEAKVTKDDPNIESHPIEIHEMKIRTKNKQPERCPERPHRRYPIRKNR